MADEVIVEGAPNGAPSEQGDAIPQLEFGPEGDTTQPQVEDTSLPSDEGEFVIPDKFAGKSAEDIAKAYVELERMKAKGEQPPADDTPPSDQPPADEAPKVEEPNKYYQEFVEKGELSEDSFKELEDAGYSREDIQERLEFEQYRQNKKVNAVVEAIGGLENYQAMEAWATENVVDEERVQFTTEFANASDYVKKVMLKDMYGRFKASTGNEGGDVIHTNESQFTAVKGYTSQHELQGS
jgi:hypothetical protein